MVLQIVPSLVLIVFKISIPVESQMLVEFQVLEMSMAGIITERLYKIFLTEGLPVLQE